MTIRLLVSVRDADEAEVAVSCGADIIDVKEPDHGPLGFSGVDVLQSVIDVVAGRSPVSAALGECDDWLSKGGPVPMLPGGLCYTKLGLSNLAQMKSSWSEAWGQVCEAFTRASPANVADSVAVAYADASAATSPAVADVLTAAIQAGCKVFLIDTWKKDHRTTFDWLTETELLELRKTTADANIQLAVAGRLTLQHLPEIRRLSPDILGVRGAVCDGADRCKQLSASRISELQSALHA